MANDVYQKRIQAMPKRWAVGGSIVGLLWTLPTVVFGWVGYSAFIVFFLLIWVLGCAIAGWLYGLLAKWHLKRSWQLPDSEAYDAIHSVPGLYALVSAASVVLVYFVVPPWESANDTATTVGVAIAKLLFGALVGAMVGFVTRDSLRKRLQKTDAPGQVSSSY